MSCYKYCLVQCCTSTTITCPDKLFFNVPRDHPTRKLWIKAMKRDERKNPKLSNITPHWCCEDHFLIKDDMQNYWQWRLTKDVKRLKLKPGVVPHIFDCQKEGERPAERICAKKRKHMDLIQEALSTSSSTPPSASSSTPLSASLVGPAPSTSTKHICAPSSDPSHPDYVPSIFNYEKQPPKKPMEASRKGRLTHKRRLKTTNVHSLKSQPSPSRKALTKEKSSKRKKRLKGNRRVANALLSHSDESDSSDIKPCSVEKCRSHYEPAADRVFHRFPLDNEVLTKKWIQNIRRENFVPTVHHVVCSDHFTADSYLNGEISEDHLKKDAIPTIFDIPCNIRNPLEVSYLSTTSQNNTSSACELDEECVDIKPDISMLPITNSIYSDSLQTERNSSGIKVISVKSIEDDSDEDIVALGYDSDDSRDVLKKKLKKSQRKLKEYRHLCKFYVKEVAALREVIKSLKQINMLSDSNYFQNDVH